MKHCNTILLALFVMVGAVYAESFDEDWVDHFNNGSHALGIAITGDGSSFIYSTGCVLNSSTYRRFAIIKQEMSDGDRGWVRYPFVASGVNYNAMGLDITFDGSYIYACGTDNDNGNNDGAVTKYDPSGNQEYATTYDGSATPGSDQFDEVDFDSSGNAYVCGRSAEDNSGTVSTDFLVAKYDTDGDLDWMDLYNDNDRTDIATALDVQGSYVYSVGYVKPTGNLYKVYLVKHSLSGTEQWDYKWPTTTGIGSGDKHIAYDVAATDSSVYLTGIAELASGDFEFLIQEYSSGGTLQWTETISKNGSSDYGEGFSIITQTVGNADYVYAAGYVTESGEGKNFYLCKYDGSGNQKWEYIYNNDAEDGDDVANALTIDDDGQIYAMGYSENSDGDRDLFCVKLLNDDLASDQEICTYRYDRDGYNDPIAEGGVIRDTDIYVDADQEEAYLIGSAANSYVASYTTINLSEGAKLDTGSIETAVRETGGNFEVCLHPNPTDNYLNATFEARRAGVVTLEIYDLGGRLVLTERINAAGPGLVEARINVGSFAPGVYALCVVQDDVLDTSRAVISR